MAEIEVFLKVKRTAIWKTMKNYHKNGLYYAIYDNPRSKQPKKCKQKQEGEIIVLACSDPPEGRQRWTLELLTKQAKKNTKAWKP